MFLFCLLLCARDLLFFLTQLAYDDLEDSPLSYWFHIEQVNCDEDDCLRTPLGDVSVQPSIEFTAPPGEYRVLCYVFDRLGAFSTVVRVASVKSPSFMFQTERADRSVVVLGVRTKHHHHGGCVWLQCTGRNRTCHRTGRNCIVCGENAPSAQLREYSVVDIRLSLCARLSHHS